METIFKINADQTASPAADIEGVKSFHRAFPTGVMIVTTQDASGNPIGLAVNAFSSVSMDPPMALVCVNKTSKSHDLINAGTHIGVNMLAHDQVEIAKGFAKSGGDKFAGIAWHEGPDGSPLIDGVAASLEMEVVERTEAGTHTVFFGVITDTRCFDNDSLVFKGGQFFDGSALTTAP